MQIKVGTINMDNAINPSIMKKYGLSGFIALLLLTAAPLSGQTLDQFKQQAAQADPTYQTRVTAIEHGSAATAIKSMQVHPTGATVPGYRVRIFLDNGQNARSSALAAKARFNEIYPDIPAYWKYDAPYFSVSVGNCLTSEEAIILWGKINSRRSSSEQTSPCHYSARLQHPPLRITLQNNRSKPPNTQPPHPQPSKLSTIQRGKWKKNVLSMKVSAKKSFFS